MTVIGERLWDCPVVHYEHATGLILSPAADGTRADLPGGYSIPRKLISKNGCWSNVDVYVNVPQSWVTNQVRLELWSFGPAGRARLQTVFCHLAGLTIESGFAFGIVLSARGAPSDGFEVLASSTAVVVGGQVQLRLWGDQSSPDYIGNTPANTLPDFRMPSRAAHLLGYFVDDETGLPWKPLQVDAAGALVVTGTGGGSVIVQGAVEPADNFPNPDDAVATFSLTGALDRDSNRWARVDRIIPTGTSILPDGDGPSTLATSGFLWGFDGFYLTDSWYPLTCIPSPTGGPGGVLVVTGIGNGQYVYADGPNSTVTFQVGGDIPFEVQAFPQIRVRETQDFRPPVGGYVDAIPVTGTGAVPNVFASGVYQATPPTLTDKQGHPLTLTTSGALRVSGSGSSTPSDTTANPTDCSNVEGFGMVWRSAAAQWHRMGGEFMRSAAAVNLGDTSIGGVLTASSTRGFDDQGNNTWVYIASSPGRDLAVGGQFHTTAPALSVNNTRNALEEDARGNLLTQIGRPPNAARDTPDSFYSDGAVSDVIKGSAGNLLSVAAALGEKGELPIYLAFTNTNAAPVNGDTIVRAFGMFPLTGDEAASSLYQPKEIGREFFSQQGRRFTTGIGVCLSSTPDVVTLIPATANVCFSADFV